MSHLPAITCSSSWIPTVFLPSHPLYSSTNRRSPDDHLRAEATSFACGVAMGLLVIAAPDIGYPHESLSTPAREEPTTRFEVFVASSCSPCVRDSYAVTTLPIAALRPSGFGPSVASMMARGGEVRFEVVRAYPLGKVSQQILVMRATLFTKAGEGQLYPISTGLLDEEEVTALATAVTDITKTASIRRAQEFTPDMTETEFRAGSVRVGTIRI